MDVMYRSPCVCGVFEDLPSTKANLGLCDFYKREREREREIHYFHLASKAYEDEPVFMPEAHLGGGGGGGGNSLRPYSQQRPMRTNLS